MLARIATLTMAQRRAPGQGRTADDAAGGRAGLAGLPSAGSSDFGGNGKGRMRVAVEGGVDAVDELVGGEQAGGFDDAAFAVRPLGLDGVQPGALDRQVAIDDADATPAPFDAAIVGADPGADR